MDKMQEHLDMDLMAEVELSRLNRQYRIMETDRKAFYEESLLTLKKQRKLIKSLKTEKENLETNIQIATSNVKKREDEKIAARLLKLLNNYEKIMESINNKKLRLQEINQQIKKSEKQLMKIRLKSMPDNEYKEKLQVAEKSVKILENRLETIIKRFCMVLTENKIMREEIDHLLKERANFNETWEKLLQDLCIGKKFLLDLVEQATIAYDQREEWCSKLQALKIRAHNDLLSHTQDMREMQRQLDHDRKLKEFLLIKGQKRIMKDLEERELKRKERSKEDKKRQMEVYETALEKIKIFCDADDIDKISAKYLKQDEENFALFNYINELNHELELINEYIEELQIKIDEQRILSEQRALEQEETMLTLNEDLKAANEQVVKDKENLRSTNQTFNEIIKGIQDVFKILDCEWSPILNLLGHGGMLNNDNIMVYLGLIEKKIANLVTDTYFREKAMLKPKKFRPMNVIKEI